MEDIKVGRWYQSDPQKRFHYIVFVTKVWNGSVYFVGLIDENIGSASASIRDFHDKYTILPESDCGLTIGEKMIEIKRRK